MTLKHEGMVIITDLISLTSFFEHAVTSAGGFERFTPTSSGPDGIQEIATLFEREVKAGEMVSIFQVAETPLMDNKAGLTTATFACTLMIVRKMSQGVITPALKLGARNETWLKTLKLIGLIRQAAEWYASQVNELEGEPYEVMFNIFQDKVVPLGKIANANTQGWLVDIDVTIPVNSLMYV